MCIQFSTIYLTATKVQLRYFASIIWIELTYNNNFYFIVMHGDHLPSERHVVKFLILHNCQLIIKNNERLTNT